MAFEPLESPFWESGDLEEVTPNTVAAVTLEEFKSYVKVTTNDEDSDLSQAILQATRLVQFEIYRATTSWALKLHLAAFPCVIELPYPPLLTPGASNPTITYVDTNGASQTLSSTLYAVFGTREFIRIRPAYGQVWPSTRYQDSAVKVAYTAGYAAANMPPEIKTAVAWKARMLRKDNLSATEQREFDQGYERVINTLRRVA